MRKANEKREENLYGILKIETETAKIGGHATETESYTIKASANILSERIYSNNKNSNQMLFHCFETKLCCVIEVCTTVKSGAYGLLHNYDGDLTKDLNFTVSVEY